MRRAQLVWFAILSLVWGCSRGLHLERAAQLGSCSQGMVFAETWFEDAPLSVAGWKVCLPPHGSPTGAVLFTVESVFQESKPGYPQLAVTNGMEVIQDAAQSYIYSLASRQFLTNGCPREAYHVEFRRKK